MAIRTYTRALGIIGALLLLTCANSAYANTVSYTGEGTNLKPGQTKGLPVLMGFDLLGKACPAGPHCFDHAMVQNFDGVSWAFPNCPEVLDGAFTLDKNSGRRVTKKSPHTFSASGSSEEYASVHVTISGRLLHHGRTAKGWFTVTEEGCSTGRVYWTATPD